MNHIEGSFRGVRDLNIYTQAWLPDDEARAAVLVVHGLGEHSGRYLNVANHLAPAGYAVYALDHIGHGRSDGARERVRRFEDYEETLTIYYDRVREWQPGKPVFLLGHSMGGLIAAHSLMKEQARFRGAVLSAPAVKVGEGISKLTIALGKVLSAVAPGAGLLALDPTGVSSDPEVVRAYVEDPLVFHGKTPARLAAEMLRAMLEVTAGAGQIELPLLILQGSADRLVHPDGARMLYETVASKDKTLKVYDGFHHEVFNEPGRAQVLQDLEEWLAARV